MYLREESEGERTGQKERNERNTKRRGRGKEIIEKDNNEGAQDERVKAGEQVKRGKRKKNGEGEKGKEILKKDNNKGA